MEIIDFNPGMRNIFLSSHLASIHLIPEFFNGSTVAGA